MGRLFCSFYSIQIPLKMKSLFIILSLIYSAQSQSCQDFSNGLCPMEESNIISSDLNIWSPDECQALCINENLCNFFSHVGSQCFMVDICDTITECQACTTATAGPTTTAVPTTTVVATETTAAP